MLVLLTGTLLHPLTHDVQSAGGHDCFVCTLHKVPATPDNPLRTALNSIQPPLQQLYSVSYQTPLLSASTSSVRPLIPRAPPA